MTFGRVGRLIGVAVLVLLANVAATILYMVLYGHVIDPGHEPAYYQAHVQVAAPYCSIAAGIPLMFVAGWWVAGGLPADGTRSAWIVWLIYVVIDLAALLSAGMTLRLAAFFLASSATKLASALFGARYRFARSMQPGAIAGG